MSSTLNRLIEGVSAIQSGNFATAIELLEEYCQNYEINSGDKLSDYIYAQQQIVKAYSYLGDKAKAIQRTKELAINGHPQVQKWAKRVLAYLSPEDYQSLPQEVIESNNQPLWNSESALMVLRSLNEYLEFGSNSHVTETLETACESLKFNTKEHLYAQVLLIEAYQINGQLKNVVSLCNQLLDNKHYLTRLLANQYLSSLGEKKSRKKVKVETDTGLLSYTEVSAIYQQGYNALIDKKYAEAFEIFKKYCESTLPGTREYLQASQFLVDFYQRSGELEQATLLCLKLIISKDKSSRRWARELLYTDLFSESPPENSIKISMIDSTGNQNSSLEIEDLNKSLVIETRSQNSIYKPVLKPFSLKTLDEFKQFYKHDLLNNLKVFETRRKQALATIIICNITVFAILLFFFQLTPIFLLVISFFSISLLLLVYILFYKSVFEAFTYKFNDVIIQKIYHFINTNHNLAISTVFSDKDNHQTLTEIRNSQFLNGLIETNYIEQYNSIRGNINNIDIKLTEVYISSAINHPYQKIFNRNGKQDVKTSVPVISVFAVIILLAFRLFRGIPDVFNRIKHGKSIDFQRFHIERLKNEPYNTQVFKGLFFSAKLEGFSQAVTIIRPKLLETEINLLYYGKKQFIKLEDPKFNSLFTVYSEDPAQAKYILSTSLIEKLLQFRKKANRNIYLSFVDDMIYIAIEYPEGIFEPNLFKSMVKFAPLGDYYQAIQLMLGIVEDLKL